MSRLALDFASAQRTLAGPKRYLELALFLCGVVALGLVGWKNEQQSEINATLRAQRDQLAARVQRRQPLQQLPAEMSAQFEQAATAHAQITTAWDDLFRALEASRGSDIALLSLNADATRREFALGGEARDFAALSAFSDRLSSDPLFGRVALSNHKLSEGAPPVVVKFELILTWLPQAERRRGLP